MWIWERKKRKLAQFFSSKPPCHKFKHLNKKLNPEVLIPSNIGIPIHIYNYCILLDNFSKLVTNALINA